MRIFLTVAVLQMVGRSLSDRSLSDPTVVEAACAPLGVAHYPERMPTLAELNQPAAAPGALRPSFARSLRSLLRYLLPQPTAEARAKIGSVSAAGRYAVCFWATRSDFMENVLGINQEWRMFEDGESSFILARARLIYADGSERIVRQALDPEDRTFYSHWFMDKRGNAGYWCDNKNPSVCAGYSNYLASSHPGTSSAPLKSILFFPVRYEAPPPGSDARAFLRQQNGPQAAILGKPFFEYNVENRRGRLLE